MGLEIRKRKDGTPIPHWYASYRDGNGKRVITPLKTALPKTLPKSLLEIGTPAFEASRARAEKELSDFQDEARTKGRADHLTARLIESKTGTAVSYKRLADLPALWRGIDRDGGAPSEKHLAWCDSVFKRFADAVQSEFLYQVTKEQVKTFLDGMRANRTDKTVRDMTILLRVAFNRLLPVGTVNPFVESIHRKKARGAIQGGAVARIPLTLEQLDRLYEAARPDPMLYALTVCAACTGMRIGDVCQLRWQSVDLLAGWVRVATSKTGVQIEVPVFDRLREVFETALADREPEAVFVWPEAARMYQANPNGIFYRGKSLFARAFAGTSQTEPEAAALAPERADLADVLPAVCKAVAGRFDGVKRDRILDTLARIASGQSYRQIEAATGRQRGQTSEDLREVEKITGLTLRHGVTIKSGRDVKTLIEDTRQKRDKGCHAASLLGWHNLRGTFVTIALDAGLPFETVAKCTGHTTAKTVRDHYYNPTREHTRQAMQKVGKTLSGKPTAALPESDPIATVAAQLQNMSKTDRARLEILLKGGNK